MTRLVLGLGALAVAGCASTGGGDPAAYAALDAELAALVNDPAKPLASLSVLAIRDGRVAYQRQLGRRFIDASNPARDRPVNADTLFRIASISKLVTTIGALRLVEEGRLSLDADISATLGYRVRNPRFPDTPITLRMLLSHTSSLQDDAGYNWPETVDLRDVLTVGGAQSGNDAEWTDQQPGTYFRYCNLAWGVVGTMMEKATGERFDRLMKRLVIDPLGLSGGYDPASLPPERVANHATLYRKATAGDVQVWNPSGPWVVQTDDYSTHPPGARASAAYVPGTNGTLFSPQGGLRATAADLGRVASMLMNDGELDGKRILEVETVETMLSPQWRGDGKNGNGDYGNARSLFNAWGLGNQIFVDVSAPGYGDRLVEGGGFLGNGHHGDAYGLRSTMAFDRASRVAVIYLVGGVGFDPASDPGAYSAQPRFEERIFTSVYRRAIQGIAP